MSRTLVHDVTTDDPNPPSGYLLKELARMYSVLRSTVVRSHIFLERTLRMFVTPQRKLWFRPQIVKTSWDF